MPLSPNVEALRSSHCTELSENTSSLFYSNTMLSNAHDNSSTLHTTEVNNTTPVTDSPPFYPGAIGTSNLAIILAFALLASKLK